MTRLFQFKAALPDDYTDAAALTVIEEAVFHTAIESYEIAIAEEKKAGREPPARWLRLVIALKAMRESLEVLP